MTMPKALCWLLLCLLPCFAHGAPDLHDSLQAIMQANRVPGAAVTIVHRGEPVQVINLGMADLARKRAVNDATTFRTASIGKIFTALAVMRLVEDGRLHLDVPLHTLAPEIRFDNPWEGQAPVRLVHLLEHTTGWDDMRLSEYSSGDQPLGEALSANSRSRVSRWWPGTRMVYSNSGPAVAGYLVQKVSGRPFEDFVADTVFKPLGMQSATYFQDTQHGATSYDRQGNPMPFQHLLYRPAGSTSATATDMARLLLLFLNRGVVDGRQLFARSTIERMESAETNDGARAGLRTGPGMGLLDHSFSGHRLLGHSGDIDGAHSRLWYEAQAGVGVVVMSNGDSSQAADALVDAVLRHLFVGRAPTMPSAHDEAPSDNWRDVEGTYLLVNPRNALAEAGAPFHAVRVQRIHDTLRLSAVLGGGHVNSLALHGALAYDAQTGLAQGVRARDPLAGDVLVLGSQVYQPVSPVSVDALLVCLIALALLSAVSMLWALVWLPAGWGVRRASQAIIAIRIWPLAASCLLAAAVLPVALGYPIEAEFGRKSIYSVWLMIVTAAYGLAAAASVVVAARTVGAPMHRGVRCFCTLHAALHLCAAAYLAVHGLIGFRTWP